MKTMMNGWKNVKSQINPNKNMNIYYIKQKCHNYKT